MKKLSFKTSGFAYIFFSLLDLGFLTVLLYSVEQALQFSNHRNLFDIISILIVAFVAFYLGVYLLANKIQLTNTYLSIRSMGFFPGKIVYRKIYLNSVKYFLIGREAFLRKNVEDCNTPAVLKDLNQFYKKYESGTFSDVMRMSIGYSYVIVVITTDLHPLILSTKPFSKRNINKLLKSLEQYQVNVIADDL